MHAHKPKILHTLANTKARIHTILVIIHMLTNKETQNVGIKISQKCFRCRKICIYLLTLLKLCVKIVSYISKNAACLIFPIYL